MCVWQRMKLKVQTSMCEHPGVGADHASLVWVEKDASAPAEDAGVGLGQYKG